jgi:predicted nuclease with TOPRIM domain
MSAEEINYCSIENYKKSIKGQSDIEIISRFIRRVNIGATAAVLMWVGGK